MQSKKKEPKWTPAVLLRRPDQIISSDYSHYKSFIPEYEKEQISMFKLLAMDYAREWFKEKSKVKEVIVVSNEAAFLQRRYVKRGMLRKKQEAASPDKRFVMKRFKNIPSRFKAKLEEQTKKKEKTKTSDESKSQPEVHEKENVSKEGEEEKEEQQQEKETNKLSNKGSKTSEHQETEVKPTTPAARSHSSNGDDAGAKDHVCDSHCNCVK